MRMDPEAIGERSESQVVAAFLRRGRVVLRPFGDNERYDLVLDDDGVFTRVQCKTGRLKDGVIEFDTCSVIEMFPSSWLPEFAREPVEEDYPPMAYNTATATEEERAEWAASEVRFDRIARFGRLVEAEERRQKAEARTREAAFLFDVDTDIATAVPPSASRRIERERDHRLSATAA